MKFPALPRSSSDLRSAARKQLVSSAHVLIICQLFVGAVFPICESVLVNKATGAPDNSTPYLWSAVLIVGAAHLFLLIVILSSAQTLPAFLVEFDEVTAQLEQASSQLEAYKVISIALRNAAATAALNMADLAGMDHAIRTKEDVCRLVMEGWVDDRQEIFFFDGGIYNFAVYWYFEEEKVLKSIYRQNDDRMVVHNRNWHPGLGHVGKCYVEDKAIFLSDTEEANVNAAIKTTQVRPTDYSYYRSMGATQIKIDGQTKGVLIITSSESAQLDEDVHTPILELMAKLLSYGITQLGEGTNAKANRKAH